MWQAPNQRIEAIKNAKKRQQDRLNKPLHLKRVRAEVRLVPQKETHAQASTQGENGQAIEARVMLNDISPHGIGIYSKEKMIPGMSVQVSLEGPKEIKVTGSVMWCQEQFAGGGIISAQAHNFRVGVKLQFATPEEEKTFNDYCAEIEKQYLYSPG
jgi:hypothetical protein